MTIEAIKARRAYQRKYRKKNKERINSQRRKWQSENREKAREYNQRYWQKIAEENQNLRASFAEFGIDGTRLNELQEIVRSRKYDDLVESAALKTGKDVSEYILMSVRENMSFDRMRIKWELRDIEQIPCSRTSFYAKRRLFFHYLDEALRVLDAEREESDERREQYGPAKG